MVFISVTRLRLRSLKYLPAFSLSTIKITIQARNAPGNLNVRLRKSKGLAFWTLTLWENKAAMEAYRSSNPHGSAMPKLQLWCDEASLAHWEQESRALPDWEFAAKQLKEVGRLSKLSHPSNKQAKGEINVA